MRSASPIRILHVEEEREAEVKEGMNKEKWTTMNWSLGLLTSCAASRDPVNYPVSLSRPRTHKPAVLWRERKWERQVQYWSYWLALTSYIAHNYFSTSLSHLPDRSQPLFSCPEDSACFPEPCVNWGLEFSLLPSLSCVGPTATSLDWLNLFSLTKWESLIYRPCQCEWNNPCEP